MSDYYQDFSDKPSQGDILEFAPHIRLLAPLRYISRSADGSIAVSSEAAPEVVAEIRTNIALILTNDCHIDKKNVRFWHICPIFPLADLNGADQSTVRKNKILHYLFLPAHKSLPESFVDLSSITTVDASLIRGSKRLMTLSDHARAALYMQHVRWISRWTLTDVTCPHCQMNFNPADTLSVRSV